MPPISRSLVEQVAADIDGLTDESAIEEMIDRFEEAQPLLLAHIDTMGEQDFNEDEQELFLYLSLVIWESFRRSGSESPQVTDAKIEALQEHNQPLLEALADDREGEFDPAWEKAVMDHPERHLLEFLDELLIEEEGFDLRPQNRPAMQVFLKVVVDALHP